MRKRNLAGALVIGALAASPAYAESIFTFKNGCQITCSGPWSFSSIPGAVKCNGTMTHKTATCPISVKIVGSPHRVRSEENMSYTVEGAVAGRRQP